MKKVGHRLSFSDNWQKLKFGGSFCGKHGYDGFEIIYLLIYLIFAFKLLV